MPATTMDDFREKHDERLREPETAESHMRKRNSKSRKDKNSNKPHTRSRTGCFTCRLRRKKCDEMKPCCTACTNLKIRCHYRQPSWWEDDLRKADEKRRMKEYIRKHKTTERVMTSATTRGEAQLEQQQLPRYGRHHQNFNAHHRALYLPDYEVPPFGSQKAARYGTSQSLWTNKDYLNVQNEASAMARDFSQPMPPVRGVTSGAAPVQLNTTTLLGAQDFTALQPSANDTSLQPMNSSYEFLNLPSTIDPMAFDYIDPQLLDQIFGGQAENHDDGCPPLHQDNSCGAFGGNLEMPGQLSNSETASPPSDSDFTTATNVSDALAFSAFDWQEFLRTSGEFGQTDSQCVNDFIQGQDQTISSKGVPYEQDEQLPLNDALLTGGLCLPGETSFDILCPELIETGLVQPALDAGTIDNGADLADQTDSLFIQQFLDNTINHLLPFFNLENHDFLIDEFANPALKSNDCFRHCALLASAVHQYITDGSRNEQLKSQIEVYQAQAFQSLCGAIDDSKFLDYLHAVMALLFTESYACGGEPLVPGVPWHIHFQILMDNMRQQDLDGFMRSPGHESETTLLRYSLALSSWVDIIGATMRNQKPHRAATYSLRYQDGKSTGLRTLMGCDDQIMYILSEASCLDVMATKRSISADRLSRYVTDLTREIDREDVESEPVKFPIDENGLVNTHQLSANITAIFRVAVRVYVLSLSPTFEFDRMEAYRWLGKFAELLSCMPAGPSGFDRLIVWPMLICGSYAPFGSQLRTMLDERFRLSVFSSNFTQMTKVVREVWHLTDMKSVELAESKIPNPLRHSKYPPLVRWRDVMRLNRWDYLLM